MADDAKYGKAIGASAFEGCTNLESIKLGDKPYSGANRTVTVSDRTFFGCTKLKTAIMAPDDSTGLSNTSYVIGVQAFMNTDLGQYATSEGHLPGVPLGTLPLMGRNIVSIGASAYENCGIEKVLLPSGLTSVGDRAFANNEMWGISLPKGVTSLGTDVLAEQAPKATAYWGAHKDAPPQVRRALELPEDQLRRGPLYVLQRPAYGALGSRLHGSADAVSRQQHPVGFRLLGQDGQRHL